MIRRRRREPEAEAAINAARRSYEQALRDIEGQAESAVHTRKAVDKLRAHNAANNYQEWLQNLIAGRA